MEPKNPSRNWISWCNDTSDLVLLLPLGHTWGEGSSLSGGSFKCCRTTKVAVSKVGQPMERWEIWKCALLPAAALWNHFWWWQTLKVLWKSVCQPSGSRQAGWGQNLGWEVPSVLRCSDCKDLGWKAEWDWIYCLDFTLRKSWELIMHLIMLRHKMAKTFPFFAFAVLL